MAQIIPIRNQENEMMQQMQSYLIWLGMMADRVEKVMLDPKEREKVSYDDQWAKDVERRLRSGIISPSDLLFGNDQKLMMLAKNSKKLTRLLAGQNRIGMETWKKVNGMFATQESVMASRDYLILHIDMLGKAGFGEKTEEMLHLMAKKEQLSHEILHCMDDAKSWMFVGPRDPEYFAQRYDLYLMGGRAKDGTEFIGLSRFKDSLLDRMLKEHAQIKKFRAYHEIRKARLLIEQDFKDGQWIEDKQTALFFKNLEKFAKRLDSEFGETEAAKFLLSNEAIGEQGELWMSKLQEIERRFVSIEGYLQQALISIFEHYEKRLLREEEGLASQISQLAMKSVFGASQEELIALIKEANENAWKDRSARFKKRLEELKKANEESVGRLLEISQKEGLEETLTQIFQGVSLQNSYGQRIAQFSSGLGLGPNSDTDILRFMEMLGRMERAKNLSDSAQEKSMRITSKIEEAMANDKNLREIFKGYLGLLRWSQRLIALSPQEQRALDSAQSYWQRYIGAARDQTSQASRNYDAPLKAA
ncbi:MAG: hypothetical protein A2Z88_05625 [Omnitrophica WOR_2 bacterium GWA2_47_8]|nr:MAG: hypothetical protein A2Z88_05625 [Omnitrophica WOR_2 bacterium GWA2_47_8]